MYRLYIHYNHNTTIRPFDSLWAANLIAITIMRNDSNVNTIDIVDAITGVVETVYTR